MNKEDYEHSFVEVYALCVVRPLSDGEFYFIFRVIPEADINNI